MTLRINDMQFEKLLNHYSSIRIGVLLCTV